jgi:hypothetical protein
MRRESAFEAAGAAPSLAPRQGTELRLAQGRNSNRYGKRWVAVGEVRTAGFGCVALITASPSLGRRAAAARFATHGCWKYTEARLAPRPARCQVVTASRAIGRCRIRLALRRSGLEAAAV